MIPPSLVLQVLLVSHTTVYFKPLLRLLTLASDSHARKKTRVTHSPGAATTTIGFSQLMATTLTPIQTLKFCSPNPKPLFTPKPLFSPKPPSISTPHTFRADKLSLSVSAATSSSNGPPSPPSPARSKHVLLFHSLSLLCVRLVTVLFCSDSLLIDDYY